jgi:hypothetical protein
MSQRLEVQTSARLLICSRWKGIPSVLHCSERSHSKCCATPTVSEELPDFQPRHSRAGGNPESLDKRISRQRGDDKTTALAAFQNLFWTRSLVLIWC